MGKSMGLTIVFMLVAVPPIGGHIFYVMVMVPVFVCMGVFMALQLVYMMVLVLFTE